MKHNRWIAAALAAAMCCPLTAFAEEKTVTQVGAPILVTADMEVAVLDVDLSAANLSVQMDPFGREGEGQLYSDPFTFTNNGETNVTLTLAGYHLTDLREDGESAGIQFSAAPLDLDRLDSATKDVCLWLSVADGEGNHPNAPQDSRLILHQKQGQPYQQDGALTQVGHALAQLAPGQAASCKVLGQMNYQGPWQAGDAITVTPIFDLTIVK